MGWRLTNPEVFVSLLLRKSEDRWHSSPCVPKITKSCAIGNIYTQGAVGASDFASGNWIFLICLEYFIEYGWSIFSEF